MEENKNVQTNVELSDKELEQTAGGIGMGMYCCAKGMCCTQCGREYDVRSMPAVCKCGHVLEMHL